MDEAKFGNGDDSIGFSSDAHNPLFAQELLVKTRDGDDKINRYKRSGLIGAKKNAFWPWIRCRWNVHWHRRQGRPKSQPIVIDLGKDRHDDHAATDTPKDFDESLILFNNFRDEDHYNIWRL